ncbi:CHY zinc finger protein [Jeotgalibacillus marinus]|uniref:CHY zinc finger protein n=1 Tax=Jeotgalibacillus marinus TaxID=86667 RepID=A0ABV3Q4P1_9BACL
MISHGIHIYGPAIDSETRCTHYHSEKDIIAIKFFCCKRYFPCVSCHEEDGGCNHAVWPKNQFDEKAVLCGSCGNEHSISTYLECKSSCPNCHASFNPGCSLHAYLYFDIS